LRSLSVSQGWLGIGASTANHKIGQRDADRRTTQREAGSSKELSGLLNTAKALRAFAVVVINIAQGPIKMRPRQPNKSQNDFSCLHCGSSKGDDRQLRDEFYTVPEFADILKVRPRSVWRWIADKKIKAVKVGGATRIPRSELDRIKRGE
jgi:excisionase family DNA binding protein